MTLSDRVLHGLQTAVVDLEPRYALLDEIGRGGMGVVYRAADRVLGREVALKVVHGGALGEARMTARLEHPGIVPVHDAGTLPDGRVFYAMKLVRGQRLDEWLRTHPSVAHRVSAFVRICEAVAFAHDQGVIHRDLKPGNVMIGSFGEVLVLDWGIACVAGEAQKSGTPGFSAPEPTAAQAADIYSLGRILRVMVPDPRPVQAICRKATAVSATDRYASVLDLAEDVNRFAAGERVLAHREDLLERGRRIAQKHKALLALLAAYLLMRMALLVFTTVR